MVNCELHRTDALEATIIPQPWHQSSFLLSGYYANGHNLKKNHVLMINIIRTVNNSIKIITIVIQKFFNPPPPQVKILVSCSQSENGQVVHCDRCGIKYLPNSCCLI